MNILETFLSKDVTEQLESGTIQHTRYYVVNVGSQWKYHHKWAIMLPAP